MDETNGHKNADHAFRDQRLPSFLTNGGIVGPVVVYDSLINPPAA